MSATSFDQFGNEIAHVATKWKQTTGKNILCVDMCTRVFFLNVLTQVFHNHKDEYQIREKTILINHRKLNGYVVILYNLRFLLVTLYFIGSKTVLVEKIFGLFSLCKIKNIAAHG